MAIGPDLHANMERGHDAVQYALVYNHADLLKHTTDEERVLLHQAMRLMERVAKDTLGDPF